MSLLLDRVSRAPVLSPALLATIAWLVVLAAMAWALSVLFWATLDPEAPSPTPRHESDPRKVVALLVQQMPVNESAPAAANASSVLMHRHVLVGVASGFGSSRGFALIESDGKPAHAIVLGESLTDGHRLVHIGHDHAVLAKDGRDTRLALTRPANNPSERPTASTASTPARAR